MPSFFEEIEAEKAALERPEGLAQKRSPEKRESTLQEIRENDERWESFHTYLKGHGSEDLAQKLDNEELGEKEIAALREKRRGFLDLEAELGRVREQFGEETIAKLGGSSEALKGILEIRGAKELQDAVLRDLTRVAMEGDEKFKKMSRMLSRATESKKTMKADERGIEELGLKHGFSKQEYAKLLARMESDPDALRKALEDKLGGSVKGWLKSLFTSAESIQKKAEELDTRETIGDHKAAVKLLDDQLGVALRDLIFKNETVNKNFVKGFGKTKKEAPKENRANTLVPTPEAQEQKETFKAGDLVLWESQGSVQWKEPKVIKKIEKHKDSQKDFAFFEDSATGIPVSELKPASASKETSEVVSVLEAVPGEQKFTEADFTKALELKKKKLSEEEVKEARREWSKYYTEHSGDQGFKLESARSEFAKEYTTKKFKGSGGGLWDFVGHLFLPDKIERALKNQK